jgi:hypothetical protein
VHLNIAFSISQWELGLWNNFIADVFLELAHVEHRMDGTTIW